MEAEARAYQTKVDASSWVQIAKAIQKVNQSPGPRTRNGADALWKLYQAPNHTLARADLEKEFGALDLHFGWFCRRVAEELGANNPDALTLVNSSQDENGSQSFTLKSSVVAAIKNLTRSK
jgi:hypothetical protein